MVHPRTHTYIHHHITNERRNERTKAPGSRLCSSLATHLVSRELLLPRPFSPSAPASGRHVCVCIEVHTYMTASILRPRPSQELSMPKMQTRKPARDAHANDEKRRPSHASRSRRPCFLCLATGLRAPRHPRFPQSRRRLRPPFLPAFRSPSRRCCRPASSPPNSASCPRAKRVLEGPGCSHDRSSRSSSPSRQELSARCSWERSTPPRDSLPASTH